MFRLYNFIITDVTIRFIYGETNYTFNSPKNPIAMSTFPIQDDNRVRHVCVYDMHICLLRIPQFRCIKMRKTFFFLLFERKKDQQIKSRKFVKNLHRRMDIFRTAFQIYVR